MCIRDRATPGRGWRNGAANDLMSLMRRTSHHWLERSCRARVGRLNLPPQFRLSQLAACLEEQRGRELWVMRNEGLPAQITGLWVGTPTRDYVFYRASLDGCHREQTILHEFAHMICCLLYTSPSPRD